MLFSGGFTFSNFLADVLSIFIFVLWFWLLITVFSDLFRRHDISGWAKVIWVIALIIFPYLGIFIYLISQHRGMAERQQRRAQQARDELRQVVGYSAADEIEKLETPEEFRHHFKRGVHAAARPSRAITNPGANPLGRKY
jgi:predicted membrane channel-forming protein YqfA (hemolysin III family)